MELAIYITGVTVAFWMGWIVSKWWQDRTRT